MVVLILDYCLLFGSLFASLFLYFSLRDCLFPSLSPASCMYYFVKTPLPRAPSPSPPAVLVVLRNLANHTHNCWTCYVYSCSYAPIYISQYWVFMSEMY